MKNMLFAVLAVAIAFLAGTRVAGDSVQSGVAVQNSCVVPKSYGEFKGMTGTSFVFENSNSGIIKVLNCKGNNWTPDAQITRSDD